MRENRPNTRPLRHGIPLLRHASRRPVCSIQRLAEAPAAAGCDGGGRGFRVQDEVGLVVDEEGIGAEEEAYGAVEFGGRVVGG